MKKNITLISGTRKGIGKALVEHLVKKNHQVIGFSRSPIGWSLDGYEHHIGDVSDESFIIQLMRSIKKEHGTLHNLINNAGIAAMNHCLLTPMNTIQNILNTNVLGTFLLCREAAKLMKSNSYGRIVNFTTVASPLKLEGESIYAASKSAVSTLTKIFSRELAQFNITVNAVGPTPIETDLIKAVLKDKIDALIARQAIKRIGEVKDVINVIDFFLHTESNFVTGQEIYLGGVS